MLCVLCCMRVVLCCYVLCCVLCTVCCVLYVVCCAAWLCCVLWESTRARRCMKAVAAVAVCVERSAHSVQDPDRWQPALSCSSHTPMAFMSRLALQTAVRTRRCVWCACLLCCVQRESAAASGAQTAAGHASRQRSHNHDTHDTHDTSLAHHLIPHST